ncbi:MAG: hypothetical protein KAI43_09590 [Candidatus Aureabacteria bacterium]|nr:hypothetical protein [Candidatus Auribacterota bacterium]
MKLFFDSLLYGLKLLLNVKILIGIFIILLGFFLGSIIIHWPREKQSKILQALYTSILITIFSSIFIIVFFPLFFRQVELSSLIITLKFLLAIGERIILAAVIVFILSIIPVIGKVMMDLTGMQFYFTALLIFNGCMTINKSYMPDIKEPVIDPINYFSFFILAILLSAIFYYLTKALMVFWDGWLKDVFARTATLIAGIAALIAYTQAYFLHLVV